MIGRGVAKEALRILAASPASVSARRLAQKYIEIYEGFSYDLSTNGEAQLLWNLNRLRPLKVVFDVGANRGDYAAEVFKVFGNASVHLFEPDSALIPLLKTRFQLEPRAEIMNIALGNENHMRPMKVYRSAEHINTLLMDPTPNDVVDFIVKETGVITGDHYCRRMNVKEINLLKVDVEGLDFEVLEGFAGMLSRSHIDVIQFEYGYLSGIAGKLMHDFSRLLSGYGLVMSPLRKRRLDFHDWRFSDNDFHSGPNWIATDPLLAAELSSKWKSSIPRNDPQIAKGVS